MMSQMINVRMSPQQRRLWDLQRSSTPAVYAGICVVDAGRRADPAALEVRLRELLDACEIFRTQLCKVPEFTFPVQQIAEHAESAIEVIDGATWTDERVEEWTRERVTSKADWAGRLEAWLVQREPASFLVLQAPTSMGDRTSLRLIADYLLGPAQPENPNLEQLAALQYGDYASWKHEVLTSPEAEPGRRHWSQIEPADAAQLVSPFQNDGLTNQSFEPAVVVQDWSVGGAVQLAALARRFAVDEADVLLAVAAVYACRHYARCAVLLGVGADGRSFPELTSGLGAFHQFLPVRFEVEPTADFGAVLAAVAAAARAAAEWQESFAWPAPVEEAPAAPYLPFLFDAVAARTQAGGTRVRFERSIGERFGLKLEFERVAGGCVLRVWYDATLFHEDGARCVARQVQALFEGIAARPVGVAVGAYALEPAAGPVPAAAEAERASVVSLAEFCRLNQVRHGAAVALTCGPEALTYDQLERRARALAAQLQRHGIGRGDLVVLLAERSIDALVAIVGIIKAGAGYLPVEIKTPLHRLVFILDDSRAGAVVAPRRATAPSVSTPIVFMDELDIGAGAVFQPIERKPSDVAYAIYTSGSTGAPKAVLIEDAQCFNYIAAMRRRLGLDAPCRFTLFSSLATDLGNTSIFLALAVGGELDVIPEAMALNPQTLFPHLAARRPDVIKTVPSYLSSLLNLPGGDALLPARVLILGGETPSRKLLDDVRRLAPVCALYNHYGPTETTIGSIMLTIGSGETARCLRPGVIGMPLTHVQVRIVNEAAIECGAGELGALYIGGAGVARGYLNRPELTVRTFVAAAGTAAGRWYATGDRVRRLPSGDIEFVGRNDDQVKIRGYRVELKEVERALARVAGVEQASVITEVDSQGGLTLAGFIQTAAADAEENARKSLEAVLPAHMVPARIVALARLPVTGNGKVDRRALAALPAVREAAANGDAPRTLAERRVAALWRDILGGGPYGIHDNFFKRGGHSLTMLKLFTRIQDECGLEVPLSVLFQKPTIEAQASAIEDSQTKGVLIPAAKKQAHYPLTSLERRIYSLQAVRPTATDYHMSAAFTLEGTFSTERAAAALEALNRKYDALRSSYVLVDGVPFKRVAESVAPPLEVNDTAATAAESLLSRFVRPFELTQAPLYRVAIFKTADGARVLGFDMHHLIADGASLEIFVDEFKRAYAGEALEPLKIQFTDYALWTAEQIGSAQAAATIEFWRAHLAGAPTRLDFKHDFPRPPRRTFAARQIAMSVGPDVSAAALARAEMSGGTPFALLWAAFSALLHHHSGLDRMIVGTNVANRRCAGTDALIGPFVNQLPVAIDLGGDPLLETLERRAAEGLMQCFDHQMVPFDEIVEVMGVTADPAFNPLFQTKLTWSAEERLERLELPGVRATRIEADTARARVDLQCNLRLSRGEIVGAIDYSAELYRPETIAELADDFATAIKFFATQTSCRLSVLRRRMATRARARVEASRRSRPARIAVPLPCRRVAS